ncbi:hypothetical protein V1291_004468 [Nitrobacteraceae bacterium AZCC 1564]
MSKLVQFLILYALIAAACCVFEGPVGVFYPIAFFAMHYFAEGVATSSIQRPFNRSRLIQTRSVTPAAPCFEIAILHLHA